jgi:hypothetical protein
MGVRYLVTDRLRPEFAVSPILEAMMEQDDLREQIGITDLGGDRRVCLRQVSGEVGVYALVPKCRYLDFCVGLTSGDSPAEADSTLICLVVRGSAGGEARFCRHVEPAEYAGRWYDLRLDVSDIGGSYAGISFAVEPSGEGGRTAVSWGRFELVKHDCAVLPVDGGYRVLTGRHGGALALTLRTGAGQFPVRLEHSRTDWQQQVRWIEEPASGSPEYVVWNLDGEGGQDPVVLSEVDFEIMDAKVIHTTNRYASSLVPVHDGDLCIYENQAALPRGLCVDRALFPELEGEGEAAGTLGTAKSIHRLPSHICGLASIESYEPEAVALRVDVDRDCLLLFQDNWYPGWGAKVDGRARPLLETDLGVRAVAVESGEHRVVLEYSPWTLRVGVAISVLGILLGIAYGKKVKES